MDRVYRTIIEKESALSEKDKRRFSAAGYLKLLLLLVFGVCVYFIIKYPDAPAYKGAAALLLAVQAAAWVWHDRLSSRLAHAAGIMEIHQRHLDRIQGKWTAFKDTGEEFALSDHPYCRDLDIAGNRSLFQYLNVTHTWHGRHAFAKDLLDAQYTEDEILKRQEAVKELASDPAFAGELEYRFAQVAGSASAPNLIKELEDDKPFLPNKVLRVLLLYGPVLLFILGGFTVIFRLRQFYFLLLCLYSAQALIWAFTLPLTGGYLKNVVHLPFKLGAYGGVFSFIAEASFRAQRLTQLQAQLTAQGVSAPQALRELGRISDKIHLRSNFLIYFALNVLFLWDLESAIQFSDWKKRYGPHCGKWFHAMGELESLSCLAVLKNVCDHTCFPSGLQGRGAEAEEMGHPLIPNGTRVTNPLKLHEETLIISGSNMSGKTTYLRTVGINIVLARAGGPVCALKMQLSDLHVITSMRITDDLSEGISTFYAELKRIKRIVAAVKEDKNTLFLIDEIFRGTNSADRLSGARTVITRLSGTGACGMITTHDLELCTLEALDAPIRNYSFSEHYAAGKILFDYKLRKGKAQTTNAKYLMELIGIL